MWRPILVYTGVYVTLFVAHIIAAANDLEILFRIIAVLITLQTMLAGLCLHLLKGDVRHSRLPVIVLSAGLGWAYAGMGAEWSISIWVLVAIILQILTEKGLKYGTPAESTDG